MRNTVGQWAGFRAMAAALVAAIAVGGFVGCEGEEPTGSENASAPADLQGAAIDGSEDLQGEPIEGGDSAEADAQAQADDDASAEDAQPEAANPADAPAAGDGAGDYSRELAAAGEQSIDEILEVQDSLKEQGAQSTDAEAPEAAEQEATAGAAEGESSSDERSPEQRARVARSTLDQMHELGGVPLDAPESVDGYVSVTFPQLSGFEFVDEPPEGAAEHGRRGELTESDPSQLPSDIQALNGEKIAISGYMIPNNFRDGGTSEFTLVPVVPSCFFCVTPAPMDWIEVKTADGEYVPYVGDKPITVRGTFDAGAIYSGVFLQSLYRMEADEVVELREE